MKIRRLQLSRFITWCDERTVTRASDVTPELIERFQRHLFYYRKKDGQPLTISSQSHWLTSLRSWMKWIKDQHVLEHSPAEDMVFPKEEKRLPRHALTQEEVEAILAQPDITRPCGLRMRAILELLYSSGLRRQEVLNLEQSDIDRSRRVILVPPGQGQEGPLRAARRARPVLARQVPRRSTPQAGRQPPAATAVRQHQRHAAARQLHLVASAQDDEPRGYHQEGFMPSLQTHCCLSHVRRRGIDSAYSSDSRS